MGGGAHTAVCIKKPENSLQEFFFYMHHTGPGD